MLLIHTKWHFQIHVKLSPVETTKPCPLFQISNKTYYHKKPKPRDLCLELSDRSEMLQAPRQQYCRSACQISKGYGHSNYQSPGIEASRDLMIRRLIGYWNRALVFKIVGWYELFPSLRVVKNWISAVEIAITHLGMTTLPLYMGARVSFKLWGHLPSWWYDSMQYIDNKHSSMYAPCMW